MAAGIPAELCTRLTHRDTAPAALAELMQLWAPRLTSGPYEPSYQFVPSGPQHRPVFTCTLSVNAPAGFTLPAVWRSSYNKNTAKREAAKAMGTAIVEQAGGVRLLSHAGTTSFERTPSPPAATVTVSQRQWDELQQTLATLTARVSALEAAAQRTPSIMPMWGNGLFIPSMHGPLSSSYYTLPPSPDVPLPIDATAAAATPP